MSDFHARIKFKTRSALPALLLICLLLASTAAGFDRQTPVVRSVSLVGPAVVNISSEHSVQQRRQPFGLDPFFDSFFRDFFDSRPQKRVSLGSGVIIDGRRGYILTNAHVVERGTVIKVLLQDEREFEARIVGVDTDSDLAVLQVDSKAGLPSVAMGNSHDLMIGETVIAIGNPFGFSHTVTTGVISALNRSLKTEERVFHRFIQTDASINPGNSGGPLLNINGELIGINTAIYAKAQGIGFAIPIDRAKRIVNELIQFGHVVQSWIGLSVQELDPRMSQYLELGERSGVLIAKVEERSPAAEAALEPGDLLTALDETKIQTSDDYFAAARAVAVGDTVNAALWRKGRHLTIPIKTRAFPKERVPQLAWQRMGVKVEAIDAAARRHYGLNESDGVVIVDVRERSYLAEVGAAEGDVIRQIDGQKIASKQDFLDAALKSRLKSAVAILLSRKNQIYYLTVPMGP